MVFLASLCIWQVSVAQIRLGNNLLHESDNCDIRTSGVTVLRCGGISGRSEFNLQATLIFTCYLGRMSLSLGHAAVSDEVLDYRFEDNQGGSKHSNDHTMVSNVRTGFTEPKSSVPRWIYRNVLDPRPISRLYFFLNGDEVSGQFQFNATDHDLFVKFMKYC